MKIVTIVGARPQFVKAATVSRAIKKYNQESLQPRIFEVIIHTGQHYDSNMSDIFFDEMDIPKPSYTLGIGGSHHGAMTGRQLEKIEQILLDEKPECVLVYGDTNSTLAGALAAAKLCIPVAHVEAGLRSFNMQMPEEVNRILTDQVSSFLFCPSPAAIANLDFEGFSRRRCSIHHSGDVMLDAALHYRARAKRPAIDGLQGDDFILVTIHRADNTDNIERLTAIVKALNEIALTTQVVIPIHPRTRQKLESYGLRLNALVTEPLGYFEILWLLDNCSLVMTDSGGLQKEAYFFNKYCITMRDQTEWVELLSAGVNELVGAQYESIIGAWKNYISLSSQSVCLTENLYGDGDASGYIVRTLAKHFVK